MNDDGGPPVVLACDFHRHYCAMLAGALDRAGTDVTMITRDHDLEFGSVPGAATEFVRKAAGPGVHLGIIPGRVRSLRGWRQAISMRSELRRSAVVHLQESTGNDLRLLLAAGARKGGYALTVHDPVHHPGDNESPLSIRLNRAVVQGAGLIFVHAEALREELIEEQRPAAEIVVIPHGVDPAGASPLPEHPALLCFGRISRYKGIDVLLDAMELLWQSVPEATLTIAGAGQIDPHAALSDQRIVVRPEYVPEGEVDDLFESARCIVLPYRQASQSGVGSRSKPYARPLVVTDVGGLPELVSDGSGLVVPSEDPARLAEALRAVVSDRELAERLGAAGAATAAREGSWDVVAGRTLDAYAKYLAPLV